MAKNDSKSKRVPSSEGTRLNITNKTRTPAPKLPFGELKTSALGENYELSLAIVGAAASRRLNAAYRGKDAAASVLAFPLTENSGEVVICPEAIRRKAKMLETSYRSAFALHFIHSLFHLKGYEHGDRMDRAEARLRKKFGL